MFVSRLVQRIQIQGIRNDRWFRISYMPTRAKEEGEVNLDDIRAVFDGIEVGLITIFMHNHLSTCISWLWLLYVS